MSARWPWAMAQTAALSLALLICRPVLIRFWTSSSSSLVLFRFCSAISADLLVCTLIAIEPVLLVRPALTSPLRVAGGSQAKLGIRGEQKVNAER